MTTYAGIDGFVKIGSTAVGEVRNWNLTISAELQDVDTLGGNGWGKVRSTRKSGSGAVECWHDPDNALQNQMAAGASVTLVLGTVDGKQITCPAVIAEVEIDQGGPTGIATRTFNFRSNGAITGI